MAKTILGIDIGHDRLKLALVRGNRVIKTASEAMPENLLKEGRISSVETLGGLLRDTMKANGIHANCAACVLSGEIVYIKNVTMPLMSTEQLEYNLPYEFNDYITDEVNNYVFDYAVQRIQMPDSDTLQTDDTETVVDPSALSNEPNMELMAVAVLQERLEDLRSACRKAGLRLVKVAPAICSYISLIGKNQKGVEDNTTEYAMLDLGFDAIRLHMFQGTKYLTTRVIEIGMSSLDDVISDIYSIDIHLAHQYLLTNFENCQANPECVHTYQNIAVELMRALNFYRFSNPHSNLSDIWVCGGGTIEPLITAIQDVLNLQFHFGQELILNGDAIESCNTFIQAIGITMD